MSPVWWCVTRQNTVTSTLISPFKHTKRISTKTLWCVSEFSLNSWISRIFAVFLNVFIWKVLTKKVRFLVMRWRKAGNVSRYARHCSRFGRVHRTLESYDSVIIRGVPRPSSRGKHLITPDDKQYVTDFVKNLVRGDMVEVSAMWYGVDCIHAINQTFIVGEDTKKSIQ